MLSTQLCSDETWPSYRKVPYIFSLGHCRTCLFAVYKLRCLFVCLFPKREGKKGKGRKENQILFSKCCALSQVDPSKQERSIQTTERCRRRNLSEDGMEQAGREHEEARHCCSATDFCGVACQPSMKLTGRFPRGTEELAEVVSMLEATGSC